MRHGVKFNPLGRKRAHRKAMMRNLTRQLIEHKRIITTKAKAKALRVHIEPLLTKAKNDTTQNRRVVFSHVQDKETIKELFGNVSAKIANRPGGYCRIIKLDQRQGDAADMAMIELVDFNETYDTSIEVGAKKKRTRRTRKKAPKTETVAAEAEVTEEVAPAVEAPEAELAEAPVVEEVKEEVVAEADTTEEAPAEETKEEGGDEAEEKEA